MWFLDGAYGEEPWHGPHYHEDVKKIGFKSSHKLEDLLKMEIEESTKRKLRQARPGQCIAIQPFSANSELMVKCLSDKQITQFRMLDSTRVSLIDSKKKSEKIQAQYEGLTNKILRHSKFKQQA